jgi:hypothetical protein
LIIEEWKIQWKIKHGNPPTRSDEEKIKELVELAGAVDMRLYE